jgi:DNA processing protein
VHGVQADPGFSVAHAIGRNKVIYGLSRATLVVTSDLETGGTWAGARDALKQSIAPVLVWRGDDAGAGNEPLVAAGARAADDARSVIDVAREAPPPQAQPSQMQLGA